MATATTQTGVISNNGQEVDANGNAFVNTPTVQAQAGFIVPLGLQDAGAVTGSKALRQELLSTVFRRRAMGQDTVLWYDTFTATAQNTAVWKAGTTSFTFSQSGGYLNFNAGAITTTGASQIYQTYRYFGLNGNSGLIVSFSADFAAVAPANAQMEFGLFNALTGTTPFTPADGVYFRVNSTGIYGVQNNGGTETLTGVLVASASIPLAQNIQFRLVITEVLTEFWWTNAAGQLVLLGTLATPAGNGQPGASVTFPLSTRLYFPGTAGSAWAPKISNTLVMACDTAVGLSQSAINAASGLMGYQGQNGGTMGTTALYSNSLAAGAGSVLTNTTAAVTGLGGQASVQPTLAAGTDGILTSYQNPAGTTAAPGRNLVVTGVRIQGAVTTVLAGGPVINAISLAFGHTAVSLATAEAAAAKAPRRIALGFETFAATAAVGVLGSAGVLMAFASPIVVAPGEYIATVLKNVGTVTTSGVITYLVTFDCYWA